MGIKYSDIEVTPLRDRKYKVLKDIAYKDITVPVGYRTNGADIPRALWSIIEPNMSDILPAVIIHDYLCDCEVYDKADLYFEEILEILQVDSVLRIALVSSVKLYHKIKY